MNCALEAWWRTLSSQIHKARLHIVKIYLEHPVKGAEHYSPAVNQRIQVLPLQPTCLVSGTMYSPLCFSPEPPGVSSSHHFHTSNAELLAVDWVVNASSQDVLTTILSIGARCHFFFFINSIYFLLYSFSCIPKGPGRLNVVMEAGGSQPALKKSCIISGTIFTGPFSILQKSVEPLSLTGKWCLSSKSRSGSR